MRCECRIEYGAIRKTRIVKCPLCLAAPDLFSACKAAMQWIPDHPPASVTTQDLMDGLNLMNHLKAATLKAGGAQ